MRLHGRQVLPGSWFAVIIGITFCASAAPAHAGVLTVSIAGAFGTGITADQLAAPDAAWALSFDVSDRPAAANTNIFSFDAPFYEFKYAVNGLPIAVLPQSIRFFTSEDGGLFTVYFGPESGSSIPEFSFAGDQVFSGITKMPIILAGSYPVDDVTYSDSINFDDEGASGIVKITRASVPIPEQSAFWFVLIGMVLLSPSIRGALGNGTQIFWRHSN